MEWLQSLRSVSKAWIQSLNQTVVHIMYSDNEHMLYNVYTVCSYVHTGTNRRITVKTEGSCPLSSFEYECWINSLFGEQRAHVKPIDTFVCTIGLYK